MDSKADQKQRVRTCVAEDYEVLADYGYKLAFETEGKKLDMDTVQGGVKSLLSKPKMGQYYLAEVEVKDSETGEAKWMPVGTTMITFEMQPRLGGLIYMIQSVYVDKDYRKMGIFRSLYQTIIDKAKADPITKAVRLYVEHDNYTAQAVYEKLGMSKLDTCNFDEKDFVFEVTA